MFYDTKVNLKRLERFVLAHEEKFTEKDQGKILFYGDSAFTRWDPSYGNKALEDCILSADGRKACVNHGIGGATAEELLYYYPRLVKMARPRALVLETYLNDRDSAYSPEEILYLESRILEYAREDFPGIRLFLCDARPIKKKVDDGMMNHAYRYNDLVRIYCAEHSDCSLICHSLAPELYLDEKDMGNYETVRKDFFIEDEVHYDPRGYECYTRMFRRILKDIL